MVLYNHVNLTLKNSNTIENSFQLLGFEPETSRSEIANATHQAKPPGLRVEVS